MTVIVFEGHDRSGKTTIAKAFADHYGCIYIRDEFLKQAASENANQSYARYQLGLFIDCFDPRKDYIIDRALLSHEIYSKIFNQARSDNVIKRTEELLKNKVLYIVCYKTGKLVDDDMFGSQEKIRDAFLALPERKDIFLLDTTDENIHSQLCYIEGALHDWENYAYKINTSSTRAKAR